MLLMGHQRVPELPMGFWGHCPPRRGGWGSGWGGPHLLQQVCLLDGLQHALLGGVLDLPPHHELIQDEIGLLEVEDDVQLTHLGGRGGTEIRGGGFGEGGHEIRGGGGIWRGLKWD